MSTEYGRRPPGGLEAEILATLWANDEALTPAQVRGELGEELAYTTVMTTLSRLYEKGLVERSAVGRAYAYEPIVDEAQLVARRMQAALEEGTDRGAALARFVGSLDASDARMLRGLLKPPRRRA